MLIGFAVLGGAVLMRKRVVETGGDPGAARDALMPREPDAEAAAGGQTSFAKIAPPAGAPAPPPAR
ncbi:hypothetical protein ABZ707_21960 [Streptomyces sp. NPDC006923]|uniref:hypothetical protein n=1 Tax=Streptomyces sp. NPDC006923 TaxID=3155355 RepID=UPI0033E7DB8E